MIKLHLGAGKRKLNGFLGVDIEPHDNIDIVADFTKLNFVESKSVQEIYCSHALEYLDSQTALEALIEWHEKLLDEGNLYLCVPDIRKLIKIYEVGGLQRLIGPLFGRWENRKNGEIIFHRMVWDFENLSHHLKLAGFKKIEEFDPVAYLNEIDPTYDDYSLAFFPDFDRKGIQISLAIKATN